MKEERAPVEAFEKSGEGTLRAAAIEGDMEYGSVMAGQIIGLINDVVPAAEIVRRTVAEAEQIICSLKKRYVR